MEPGSKAVNLNLRHKLALCATLVCVGLIVLLGGGTRAAVGIGILGIAFSWAFGSNHRLVHWLFVIFGVPLLIPAVVDALRWPTDKPEIIKDQTSIIAADLDMVKNDMSRITEESDRREQAKDREEHLNHSDALFRDQMKLARLQNEGIIRHVVRNDWRTILGGLLLLSSGLGLVFKVKTVRNQNFQD